MNSLWVAVNTLQKHFHEIIFNINLVNIKNCCMSMSQNINLPIFTKYPFILMRINNPILIIPSGIFYVKSEIVP